MKKILGCFLGILVFMIGGTELFAAEYYYDKFTVSSVWANGTWGSQAFGTITLYPSASWDGSNYVTSGTPSSHSNAVGDGYTVSNTATRKEMVHYYPNYNGTNWETWTTYKELRDGPGSLVEADIIAENGTYPLYGKYSDGFFYDRKSLTNATPTMPSTITVPTKAIEGTDVNISWEASTDPEGNPITYNVQSIEYSGSSTSYGATMTTSSTNMDVTIGEGVWVKFRVRATDGNTTSSYKTSTQINITSIQKLIPNVPVLNNKAISISIITDKNLVGTYTDATYGNLTAVRNGDNVDITGTLKNITVGTVKNIMLGDGIIRFTSIIAPVATKTISFY